MEFADLSELLDSTSAMTRDLEALRNQHQSMLVEYDTETVDSGAYLKVSSAQGTYE